MVTKKQLKDMDKLKEKILLIADIIGEPINVNIGVENIKGKSNLKILNIETKTGLITIDNPLSKLTQALYSLNSVKTEILKDSDKKIDYTG